MVVAVVHAEDGVRYVAAGQWAEDVAPALVEYVRQRAEHVLWEDAHARVRALLAADLEPDAIATYFEHVGSRWDDERLEIYTLISATPRLASAASEANRLTTTTSTFRRR